MRVHKVEIFFFFFFIVVMVAAPFSYSYAETAAQRRARLQAELTKIESEIQAQEKILKEKSTERQSLERDVAVLNAQVYKAQLAIRRRNITISNLSSKVSLKNAAIEELNKKIEREKESLQQLITKTNEIDNLSLFEIILGKDDISTIFTDIDSFNVLKSSISKSFKVIDATKKQINFQKNALIDAKTEELDLRRLQVLEKNKVEQKKKEKKNILTVTKGQEKIYEKIVAEKKKSAAEIRSALFALRDSAAIPFGKAYDYAKEASIKTHVRPAITLAILTQETNLGENVGQCLLTNSPNKGDGKGKNTGRAFRQVMKGSRDVDPFMQIVNELGLDPFSQVVSCPPGYGYGGAMGPAQFIPSTWVLYKKRIAKASGENPPNPWNPRTAVFATSLLMMDNGADGGTYASERLAALRYFAGWKNARKSAYAFYGDSVMELATKIQRQIDIIEGK